MLFFAILCFVKYFGYMIGWHHLWFDIFNVIDDNSHHDSAILINILEISEFSFFHFFRFFRFFKTHLVEFQKFELKIGKYFWVLKIVKKRKKMNKISSWKKWMSKQSKNGNKMRKMMWNFWQHDGVSPFFQFFFRKFLEIFGKNGKIWKSCSQSISKAKKEV